MSLSESSPKRSATKRKPAARCPSASQIARNVKSFETWSLYQGCEQVSFSDLPEHIKGDVEGVLDISARIPCSWAQAPDTVLTTGTSSLSHFATPDFLIFISLAFKQTPSLFTDDSHDSTEVTDIDTRELYAELSAVFMAWKRLRKMREAKERWSEADFVENVYNVLRSPAISKSSLRVHCSIALPQPAVALSMSDEFAGRILNAKTVNPDGAIFVPSTLVRYLNHSSSSTYKTLKRTLPLRPTKASSRSSAYLKASSDTFREQATPRSSLPSCEGFEFVSCFWEDKKPLHPLLDDAYRQNRMSTAAAARHLCAFKIKAPIFGLVWAEGKVGLHVDWWTESKVRQHSSKGDVVISSASYPGLDQYDRSGEGRSTKTATDGMSLPCFNSPSSSIEVWNLDRPGHLLHVYFLLKNIDRWTCTGFLDRVTEGLDALTVAVEQDPKTGFKCWKKEAAVRGNTRRQQKENLECFDVSAVSSNSQDSSSPKKIPSGVPVKRKKKMHC